MNPSASPPAQPLAWRLCPFDQLSVHELHAIHRARQQVFVVEQACVYPDADAHDMVAWHVAAWAPGAGLPSAYARLLPPGEKYPEPSMGRVLTQASVRGTGLGLELVRRTLRLCARVHAGWGMRISAQSRLEKFYAGFGFVAIGEPYLEDGIAHTEMLLDRLDTA